MFSVQNPSTKSDKIAPIAIIDYGMGNIHSVHKALELYYPSIIYTQDPEIIKKAKAIVLPGDGSFVAAKKSLIKRKLEAPLKKAFQKGIPLLGICIGFQILFTSSEETWGSQKKKSRV